MVERGRRVYTANGCFYCHSEQVRADYAASDIDRKWGERRSAPRDYIFARPVLLGKSGSGPTWPTSAKRAPAEERSAAPAGASPTPGSLARDDRIARREHESGSGAGRIASFAPQP